jgi:GNAT superfamily N-acetyltransferase
MTNISFVRADNDASRHLVNEFFTSMGYDAPVHSAHDNAHISVMLDDTTVRGAAYAATPETVAAALMLGGQGVEGLAWASQVQSLDVIVVHPAYRGRGYGSILLESVAAHAYLDFGARHLITRIAADDPELLTWFSDRGFQLAKRGLSFSIAGVPMMPTAGYRDAYLPLTKLPMFAS